ncbi:SWIM zinc finger family protein [Blastococcus litoris]|uniref:SWIM zinc finger family protein n=1 Tax=Blastococcus litoris TaxID=2171622 RepID=UPI000E301831|nr:SWIM zinc finger family protein [Blastococcus litoris]
MPTAWSADQVLALAPDSSSVAAARKLSGGGPWSGTGAAEEPAAVWGLCAGSGKTPYQTVVDLTGPAYTCSCPSRKFPCKHALGLLLLWAAGGIGTGSPPDWAQPWLAGRAERAERAAGRTADAAATPDPEAAARRAEQRTARVAAGVEELGTWLADQVRGGLAGLERAGYRPFETVAARMVDAQAPGLASRLRALPGVVAAGDGWPGRLLEELALLHLAVAGHRRLGELPEELAACVRREVGYPVAKDDVLASAPVRDQWQVLAVRDREEDRLTARRVWLHGSASGRVALVLSFAPPGQPLDASLVPGTSVEADLHFYPGAAPLRALVGERSGEPRPPAWPAGGTLRDAARAFAAAVAADPWTRSWPVVVRDLTVVPGEAGWTGIDARGDRAPLLPDADLWRLLAVSAGRPVVLAAEHTPAGLRPLAVLDGDRQVQL